MEPKYVVIIQCALAHQRCSGFACAKSFYDKTGKFEGLEGNPRLVTFNCGGCCGKSVSAKLAHFTRQLQSKEGIAEKDVAVYLSSCMTTDNYHYDRCPHVDYIRDIIRKRRYENVTEGTYISRGAHARRESGEYHCYDEDGCRS